MARRVITPEIFEDEWFGTLPDRQALIWFGLFGTIADDQGRFADNAVVIRSRLFAYRDVPVADVAGALEAFVQAGKLHRYRAGDKPLMQIVTWWEHQRPRFAAPSAFPAPSGWTDRVKTRTNGRYVEACWELAGGFMSPEEASCEGLVQGVRTNDSHEGLVLAHEPVPVPEPEKDHPSSSDEEDAADAAPIAEQGEPATCPVRDRDPKAAHVAHTIRTALGSAHQAGVVYNPKAPGGRLYARLCERLCALGHLYASAPCEARLPVCQRALARPFEVIAESRPQNWQAFLTSMLEGSDPADLVGEEILAEYRALEKNGNGRPAAGIVAGLAAQLSVDV